MATFNLEGKNAVIIARASTTKQVDEGDTLQHQIDQCMYFIDKNKMKLLKTFSLIESGRKDERVMFQEVITYCLDTKNKVDVAVFKDISRFTREGSNVYLTLKHRLGKANVRIMDTLGVIQEEVNTLEHLGVAYLWSTFAPSVTMEIAESEGAKSELRNSLTRMIGAEIAYVRDPASFSARRPEFGYQNVRVEIDGRKRSVRAFIEPEAGWIRKMFELRAEGILTDEEIVKKLNVLGFRTSIFNRRDKRTKKIIGKFGAKPLNLKHFRRLIKKTIYAGVVSEKWVTTPFKSNYWNGIVSVDLFNNANKGKVYIEIKPDNTAVISENKRGYKIVRNKNNPTYPYKNFVLCPYCKTPLKGSASTGKTGDRYPYYHCERGHKRFAVRKADFDGTIANFMDTVRFKKSFSQDVRIVVRELYQQSRKTLAQDALEASNRVNSLKSEWEMLMERIINTESSVVRKDLEGKYEDKKLEWALAMDERNKNEQTELNLDYFENDLLELMENPSKLLLQGAKTVGIGNMFSRFFTELPTYEELVSGNPRLTPIFELSRHQDLSRDNLVTPGGFEPPIFALRRQRPNR